jgi:hypothetical protein
MCVYIGVYIVFCVFSLCYKETIDKPILIRGGGHNQTSIFRDAIMQQVFIVAARTTKFNILQML